MTREIHDLSTYSENIPVHVKELNTAVSRAFMKRFNTLPQHIYVSRFKPRTLEFHNLRSIVKRLHKTIRQTALFNRRERRTNRV